MRRIHGYLTSQSQITTITLMHTYTQTHTTRRYFLHPKGSTCTDTPKSDCVWERENTPHTDWKNFLHVHVFVWDDVILILISFSLTFSFSFSFSPSLASGSSLDFPLQFLFSQLISFSFPLSLSQSLFGVSVHIEPLGCKKCLLVVCVCIHVGSGCDLWLFC